MEVNPILSSTLVHWLLSEKTVGFIRKITWMELSIGLIWKKQANQMMRNQLITIITIMIIIINNLRQKNSFFQKIEV